MYLYLDLIMLLNFLIDFLLLWMTAFFRKIPVKKWRLALAAFIGSWYVLLLFSVPKPFLYSFWFKVCVSLVLIYLAFGFVSLQTYLANFFTFYFVSFVTGGGMLGLHYLLKTNHEFVQGMLITQSSGYGDLLSWLFVLCAFPAMYWFSKSRWREIEISKMRTTNLVQVSVHLGNKVTFCQGLLDTGNQLYDPLSKTPVMIMEVVCLQDIVSSSLLNLSAELTSFGSLATDVEQEWLANVRLIPYRGVQNGMQLMVAFKPDLVTIETEESTYHSSKVLIGISNDSLSKEGQYQAIVHPALLQQRSALEHSIKEERNLC